MASRSDFSGKVAIITGASSGIGLATAILFARKGASVVLCGRNQDRLDTSVDQCKDAGSGHSAQFISVNGDVTDKEVRKSIVAKTVECFGRVDILVLSAGELKLPEDIYNCTEETYDSIFNTNVKSLFFLIQEALPHLEKSGGNIINVSSILSTWSKIPHVAYPMSKAAIDHMTHCLALNLAPKGIRVNAVNPSFVPTRIVRHSGDDIEKLNSHFTEMEGAKQPLYNKCVGAEDVADSIAFLASDGAKFITGQCQIVDGGRHFNGSS